MDYGSEKNAQYKRQDTIDERQKTRGYEEESEAQDGR